MYKAKLIEWCMVRHFARVGVVKGGEKRARKKKAFKGGNTKNSPVVRLIFFVHPLTLVVVHDLQDIFASALVQLFFTKPHPVERPTAFFL